MNIGYAKMVEFGQVKEDLTRIGKALESLYKANTKSYESELKKLAKQLEGLQNSSKNSTARLSELEKELRNIKAIYLSEVSDATLESKESLGQFIQERTQGLSQNKTDISKAKAYYNLLEQKSRLEEDITVVQEKIETVEKKIESKKAEVKKAKDKFSTKYSNFINGLCEKGKIGLQNIKVNLAGSEIILSDTPDFSTISLSNLRKLNKIAQLIEVKAKQEELKASKDSALLIEETQLQTLEQELLKEIESSKEEDIPFIIKAEKEKAVTANKEKIIAEQILAYAKSKGVSNSNQMIVAILNEKAIKELEYNSAIAEINRLQKILIDSTVSIKEKKAAIKNSKAVLEEIKKTCSSLENNINKVSGDLLTRLSIALDKPNVTFEEGIEGIKEIVDETPYAIRELRKQQS